MMPRNKVTPTEPHDPSPSESVTATGGIHLAPRLSVDDAEWPRITLVTPVYNGVRYIEDTIRSIVYQGYPNLEYIVVDGGSSDGTVDIIRQYQKHISWWVSPGARVCTTRSIPASRNPPEISWAG